MLGITTSLSEAQSRYFDQLDALSYPAIEHMNKAVNLHWNLHRGKQHTYEYRERGFNSQIIRGHPQDNLELISQQVETTGNVILQSTFDKKARLSLKQEINLETMLPDGGIVTQSGLKDSYVIENISPGGEFITRKPIDIHFQSLMRLPDRIMNVGDTVTIPVGLSREQEYGNIKLTFAGEMIITLAGYARCYNHVCAELHTRTRITEFALPETTVGKVNMHYDANGRSWFDLDDRILIESMRTTLMEIDTETPAQIRNSGPEDFSDTVHVVSRYDTLVHLKHTGSGPSLGTKLTIKKYRRDIPKDRN